MVRVSPRHEAGRPARPPGSALLSLIAVAALLGAAPGPDRAEREALFERTFDLASRVKGGSLQPHWMADGATFWYAEGAPDASLIYKVNPRRNTRAPLFDRKRLWSALGPLLGREPSAGLPFDAVTFEPGERAVRFQVAGQDFVLRLDTYAIARAAAPTDEEHTRAQAQVLPRPHAQEGVPSVLEVPSPDGRWFATEKDHNVWLRSPAGGAWQPLTDDGRAGDAWDLDGARWSPDGSRLAVLKVDRRNVRAIPVVQWLAPEEGVEWAPYPRAGGPLARTEVHVLDVASRRAVHVDVGPEADHYLFVQGWRARGSELLVVKIGRTLQRMQLLAADPSTGRSRVVLEETSRTFLGGGMNLIDGGWKAAFTPLDDGEQVLLQSERDGWNHLYLYDLEGNLRKRLTEGRGPVVQVVGVDEGRGWVYFTAHPEREIRDTHLYRVGLDGRGRERLTEGTGQHSPELSPSRAFFVDTHSNLDRPPAVELRRADGKLLQVLSKADVGPLRDAHWQTPEAFVVKAADGATDLHGVLVKPHDFDPGRTYPVVDWIYAGPQASVVPRDYLRGAAMRAIAHLGFVVFMVDARGTPERGKAFQDVVYLNLGRHEIPDHVATLRQLARERPYMDLARVGIVGHSYGGYFATRALLTAPDAYAVGIASAAPQQLVLDPVGIEPYLGLPPEHPEAYAYASNLPLAPQLAGRLLLIAGTSDVNVPFSETLRMADALNRAGKRYDLLVLPGRDHGVPGDPAWRAAVRRYLRDHLLDGSPRP